MGKSEVNRKYYLITCHYQDRWRRGRNSNPRCPCGHNGFRDRPDEPLRHLSASGGQRDRRRPVAWAAPDSAGHPWLPTELRGRRPYPALDSADRSTLQRGPRGSPSGVRKLRCPRPRKPQQRTKVRFTERRRREGARQGRRMYAVVKTGGKQYRVAANDLLRVEKLNGAPGDIVELGEVLMVAGEGGIEVGSPLIAGASVAVEIVGHVRGDRIIVFKKRRRSHYRRRNGHRQDLTQVRITEILTGGARPSKKSAAPPAEAAARSAEFRRGSRNRRGYPARGSCQPGSSRTRGGCQPGSSRARGGCSARQLPSPRQLSAQQFPSPRQLSARQFPSPRPRKQNRKPLRQKPGPNRKPQPRARRRSRRPRGNRRLSWHIEESRRFLPQRPRYGRSPPRRQKVRRRDRRARQHHRPPARHHDAPGQRRRPGSRSHHLCRDRRQG